MDVMPDNVLTIEELAVYLKIPKSTLYKLVREGKIPCQKVGRHWRFRKVAIDAWIERTPLPNISEDHANKHHNESDAE